MRVRIARVLGRIAPRRTNVRLLLGSPLIFARFYWIALLILCAGAVADAVTTYRNLALFGPEVELHLAQRLVSEVFGVVIGVPLAKLTQFGFVVAVAAWWRPWCGWLMGCCGVLYLAAAVSNHFLLL